MALVLGKGWTLGLGRPVCLVSVALEPRELVLADSSLWRERGEERAGLPSPALSSTCSEQVRPQWVGRGVEPGVLFLSSLHKEETPGERRKHNPELTFHVHSFVHHIFAHFLFLSAKWRGFKDVLAITEGSTWVMNSIFPEGWHGKRRGYETWILSDSP